MHRTASGAEGIQLFSLRRIPDPMRQSRSQGILHSSQLYQLYSQVLIQILKKREFGDGLAEGLAETGPRSRRWREHRVREYLTQRPVGTFLAHIIDLVAQARNPQQWAIQWAGMPMWRRIFASLERLLSDDGSLCSISTYEARAKVTTNETLRRGERSERFACVLDEHVRRADKQFELLSADFLSRGGNASIVKLKSLS